MSDIAFLGKVIKSDDKPLYRYVMTFCPACEQPHPFTVEKLGEYNGPVWDWNMSLTKPTFSPSMLVGGNKRCHSFLRNGVWEFLDDCDHDMAGQTVPMVSIPDWLWRRSE